MIAWQLFLGANMKWVVAITGLIVFVFCIRLNFFSFSMSHSFYVRTDSRISPESTSQLHAYLLDAAAKKTTLRDVINHCKERHSIIKNISIAYMPSHSLVSIVTHKPSCIVNDGVLLENGDIVKKSVITDSLWHCLPAITVASEVVNHANLLAKQALHVLPKETYEHYVVEIHGRNDVTLTDKKNDHFIICCSLEQHIISQELFNQCQQVKQSLFKQEISGAQKKWLADIRFADYIIAYKA